MPAPARSKRALAAEPTSHHPPVTRKRDLFILFIFSALCVMSLLGPVRELSRYWQDGRATPASLPQQQALRSLPAAAPSAQPLASLLLSLASLASSPPSDPEDRAALAAALATLGVAVQALPSPCPAAAQPLAGPTPAPVAAAPVEEAALDPLTGLPATSTLHCMLQPDGSDLCEYSNVCVDLPDPTHVDGGGVLKLLLLNDAAAEAELLGSSSSSSSSSAGGRYAHMRDRWPGWTLPALATQGFQSGFDSDTVDFMETRLGSLPRAIPFGLRALADTIAPSDALPALFGGSFQGEVVWLDDLWALSAVSEEHLWTCTSSVCAPIAGAAHANMSAGLRLPPLHNLLLVGGPHFSRAFAWDGWHNGKAFWNPAMPEHGLGWCWGFLAGLLGFASPEGDAEPFLGSGRHYAQAPGGHEAHYRERCLAEESSAAAALSSLLYDVFVARPAASPPLPGASWRSTTAAQAEAGAVAEALQSEAGGGAGGSGAFPGAGAVEEAVGLLLAPCLALLSGGAAGAPPPPAAAAAAFSAPPAAASGSWSPLPGSSFHSQDFTWDAAQLAFNASEAAGWSAAHARVRAMLWCTVKTLVTPQSRVKVPFSSLFFRDARGPSSAASSAGSSAASSAGSSTRHAGRSTRVLFSSKDLLFPPAALAALRHALTAAREELGEDAAGVWAESLQAELAARATATASASADAAAPRPLPLHSAPYADAPLSRLPIVPALNAAAQFLAHGRRLRVCAARAAVPGNRDVAVAGLSEANYLREFAHRTRERVRPGSAPVEPALRQGAGGFLPTAAAPSPPPPPGVPEPDGYIGRAWQLPILVLDRGQAENGFSVVGPWGRRFANLPGMLAVLAKYNLSATLVQDVELLAMSFEEQVALFNSHKVFIAAHGAGMQNSLFMPPRSAIIEVTPRGMWCPLFFKQAVAAGHFTFPIHSLLHHAQQTFSYSSGLASPQQAGYNESAQWHHSACVLRGHFWSAQTSSMCFHEAKTVPVLVPLHEFEAQLLHALDAVGAPTEHLGSAHHQLEGIPTRQELLAEAAKGNYFPWAAGQGEYYAQRAWTLTPPARGGSSKQQQQQQQQQH